MAENARTTKPAGFGKKLAATGSRVTRFFKDIRNELRKVIWPTKEQLVKNTISVLAICFLIGAFIWAFDAVFTVFRDWALKR
ncbi:MAG: preprotein translocase subunit SecE [Clostridiaceae bacterium]|jgi:preprotein translocase subunit SecE|nr:preprotein translocase subunit SecE [Clostridiaceae bacterium]